MTHTGGVAPVTALDRPATDLATGLVEVRRRIERAGGDPERVRVVAVTKGLGPEAVRAAVAGGLVDVGESYAQELVAKAGALRGLGGPGSEAGAEGEGLRWHFLGPVQRNKVKRLAGLVHLWQAVDRASTGEEVAAQAPGARVLVQVNVTGEPTKAGCAPHQARDLVARLRDLGLDVAGLMTIGRTGPVEAARPGFRRLRELADDLGLEERSMGMSADLEVAVAEGATIVRVGRALFGERPRIGQSTPVHGPSEGGN